MAYLARNLSVLAYANGFTLWHYRSREPLVEILSNDYFTPGCEMFRPGDFLMVNASGEGATLMVETLDHGSVSVVALAATAGPSVTAAAAAAANAAGTRGADAEPVKVAA